MSTAFWLKKKQLCFVSSLLCPIALFTLSLSLSIALSTSIFPPPPSDSPGYSRKRWKNHRTEIPRATTASHTALFMEYSNGFHREGHTCNASTTRNTLTHTHTTKKKKMIWMEWFCCCVNSSSVCVSRGSFERETFLFWCFFRLRFDLISSCFVGLWEWIIICARLFYIPLISLSIFSFDFSGSFPPRMFLLDGVVVLTGRIPNQSKLITTPFSSVLRDSFLLLFSTIACDRHDISNLA